MYSLHRLCAAVTLETPAAVVKCVEASTERVYACGSDGRVRVLGLEPPAGHNQVRPTLRARQADGQLAELQLLQEIAVSTSRKAIDRIALLTRIGKAAVLSGAFCLQLDVADPTKRASSPSTRCRRSRRCRCTRSLRLKA